MAEINCFGKTENYSDKITLLNTYDTNDNGRIDTMELQQAIADWNVGKITVGERDIVEGCWKLGEDGISKFCRRRPPCGDYGDVDGDGYVTQTDADMVAAHVAEMSVLTTTQLARADVYGDGDITVRNVALIARYAAGIEGYDTFPVCAKVPPKPECTEGDKKPGYVCIGGKWVPVGTPPDVTPPEYLTPDDALLRIRAGEKCYIKCTLPILDMLPGIPYTPGAWVPPFCAITGEP